MSQLAGMLSAPVARATLRERGPAFLPGAMAVLLLLAAISNAGQGSTTQTFSGFGTLFLIGLTMALGAGLVSDEIESGHAQLLLLRPITRAQWYGGRVCGALAALALAVGVAWLGAGAVAIWRGGKLDLAWVASLPLTLIQGAAWLSVLAALSVVLPRWMNIGAILAAAMAWLFLSFAVPLALGRPQVFATMREISHYLGPQGLDDLLRDLTGGARPNLAPLFYDLLWIFAPWLAGVLLLNRRELARRRG